MASAVQQEVSDIQLDNYLFRTFPDMGYPIVLLSFPVVMITAVGYDYSK